MSFPAYGAYKAAGVEWLPQVPEHWHTGSLRWLSRRYSGGTPDKNTQEYWENGTVPWLNSGAVNQILITEPSTYISGSGFENSSAKWIPSGALVMALAGQGKTKGMVAQLAIPSTCNQSMAAIVPTGEMDARFLLWWLQSNYQNIRNMAGGDMRDGLNLDLLGEIQCPVPPKSEQVEIATFLDREAAKIDALIEEQKRLIELLKEKRQVVISQAVTTGLDPNVPMKDAGVEWLGKVPAHWAIGPLKRFASVLDGRRIPLSAEERGGRSGDIPYYGASGVIDWIDEAIFEEDLVLVSEDGANLLNRSTPIAFVARGRYWVNNHAHILKPMCKSLVYWAERIDAVDLIPFVTGSAQPKLTIDALANIVVAVPPTDGERATIEQFILRETQGLDELAVEADTAMGLLKERRSALISAAVTGKIDVRGLGPRPHGEASPPAHDESHDSQCG